MDYYCCISSQSFQGVLHPTEPLMLHQSKCFLQSHESVQGGRTQPYFQARVVFSCHLQNKFGDDILLAATPSPVPFRSSDDHGLFVKPRPEPALRYLSGPRSLCPECPLLGFASRFPRTRVGKLFHSMCLNTKIKPGFGMPRSGVLNEKDELLILFDCCNSNLLNTYSNS